MPEPGAAYRTHEPLWVKAAGSKKLWLADTVPQMRTCSRGNGIGYKQVAKGTA